MKGHTWFRALAIAACLSCYATILIGGNVIASGSGLGCSEWPACQGGQIVPPLTGAAAIEFSHRASAAVLSVLVLCLTAVGFVAERGRWRIQGLCLAALSTVILEAILGGVVVDSRLAVTIVLVHLAIATVLFGLLLLVAILANLRELPPGWKNWARRAMETAPPAPARSPAPTAPNPPSVPTAAAPAVEPSGPPA